MMALFLINLNGAPSPQLPPTENSFWITMRLWRQEVGANSAGAMADCFRFNYDNMCRVACHLHAALCYRRGPFLASSFRLSLGKLKRTSCQTQAVWNALSARPSCRVTLSNASLQEFSIISGTPFEMQRCLF